METNNILEEFIQKLIEEAGLVDMPADFIDEYKSKLILEAQKRMGLVAINSLKPEDIDELNKLSEESEGSPEKISQFLKDKIDNYEEVMANALKDFGDEVLEKAKALDDANE